MSYRIIICPSLWLTASSELLSVYLSENLSRMIVFCVSIPDHLFYRIVGCLFLWLSVSSDIACPTRLPSLYCYLSLSLTGLSAFAVSISDLAHCRLSMPRGFVICLNIQLSVSFNYRLSLSILFRFDNFHVFSVLYIRIFVTVADPKLSIPYFRTCSTVYWWMDSGHPLSFLFLWSLSNDLSLYLLIAWTYPYAIAYVADCDTNTNTNTFTRENIHSSSFCAWQ